MNNPSADIALKEWVFKNDHMRRMACDICDLAIKRGLLPFSANDLPRHGEKEQGGSGIAGTLFKQLSEQLHIIAPVCFAVGDKLIQDYENNEGGNKIGMWRLNPNGGMARASALLRSHGRKDEKQQELGI